MAPQNHKKTPRDILRILFRRRNMFLISVWLFSFLALQLSVHFLPLKYTGTAKFQRRAETVSKTRDVEGFDDRKLTLAFELAGDNAVRQVVEELGMTRGLPRDRTGQLTAEGEEALQQMVKKLRENIEVTWDVKSKNVDLVSISVVHEDPDMVRRIPNTLVTNYINHIYESTRESLAYQKEYYAREVNDCEDRIRKITREKILFETEHADMMPDSPMALQERIDALRDNLEAAQRTRAKAQKKIARLDAMRDEAFTATQPADQDAPESSSTQSVGPLASTRPAEPAAPTPPVGPLASTQAAGLPPTTQPTGGKKPSEVVMGPNPELARVEQQIRDYQNQLDTMLNIPPRLTEAHPKVKAMKSMIEQLNKRIDSLPREVVIQTVFSQQERDEFDLMAAQLAMDRADAQAELDDAERQIEKLQIRIARYEQLQQNFAPVRQEYLQILNNLEKRQNDLDDLQTNFNKVQMALSAEIAKRRTQLDTVEAARKQFRPSSPSLMIILAGSLLGGVAFGVGLVLLTVVIDRSISSPDEAQDHFDVPVVGIIREIVPRAKRRWRTLRGLLVAPLVTVLMLATLGISILNVVLWLHHPDEYKQWDAAPVQYLETRARTHLPS